MGQAGAPLLPTPCPWPRARPCPPPPSLLFLDSQWHLGVQEAETPTAGPETPKPALAFPPQSDVSELPLQPSTCPVCGKHSQVKLPRRQCPTRADLDR